MTRLRVMPYHIQAACIGPENPLPYFRSESDDITVNCDPNVPKSERARLGKACGHRVLPHRLQDTYTRIKEPKGLQSIVLENDFLKAVFLADYGGRLVQLTHKASGRELIDRNPVFQPANLALRNAWFSGGIEWNTCHFGHYYLTCSPVFFATVDGPGYPILRLYEWDRVKCFYWQIDFHLPPDSGFLFSTVRIHNPHDCELPMYWWTNIGVPEDEGSRLLAPAQSAIRGGFGPFRLVDFPFEKDYDSSYSTNIPYASEFFLRIPAGERKWMAHLDKNGTGLFQTSTDRLLARKMFVWGMSQGGRRWQDYLIAPGRQYLEIQAGLAQTQFETILMPGRTSWTWTEVFGLLEVLPELAHSPDWNEAVSAAADKLEAVIPREKMNQLHKQYEETLSKAPSEILSSGSGWGALESARKSKTGEPDDNPGGLLFSPETIGYDQQPWLSLLNYGYLPAANPEEGPGCYLTQRQWTALLEESLQTPKGNHWLAWLHFGVMRMEERDYTSAREAWEKSLTLLPTSWALRNLAVLELRQEKLENAIALYEKAWQTGPRSTALAVEMADLLLRNERYERLLEFIGSLPEETCASDRLTLIAAWANLRAGNLDAVEPVFSKEFADIREGEASLTDLWFEWQAAKLARQRKVEISDDLKQEASELFPPPAFIDFRVLGEG